jgi:hypothetical protein
MSEKFKTMKMRMAVYFKKNEKGNYVSDAATTDAFLKYALSGIETPGQLTLEEMEYLKAHDEENGLLIHIDRELVSTWDKNET